MRLASICISTFLFAVVLCAEDTMTEKTSIWATGTNSDGVTTVTRSYFTQTFMSTYTAADESIASGAVGMGTISGTLGGIRAYPQSTVSQNGAVSSRLSSSVFSGKTQLHLSMMLVTIVSSVLVMVLIA